MWIAALLLGVGAAGFQLSLAPAESLWVEVGGSGPAVVLVPGLFGSAYGYRGVTALLQQQGYRTVVIEPLGVGRSSRPGDADYSLTAQAARLAAALDTLGLADVVLVAHSVGASMALRLADRRPDLVRAFVSLDGGAAEAVTTPGFRRALRFAPLLKMPGGRGRLRHTLVEQLRSASGDPSWITPDVIDAYTAPMFAELGHTMRALRSMARATEPEPLAPRLPDIRTPVLLLVGTAPRTAGLQQAEIDALRERLPHFAVERLAGVGHYIHEEAPAAVAAAVTSIDRAARAAPAHSSTCCR